MATNSEGNHGAENCREERCQEANLDRVAECGTDLRRTTWIHPILEGEALPNKVGLTTVVKGEGNCVTDWNEKVGKGNNRVDTDEVALEPARYFSHTSSSVPALRI